MTTDTTQTDTTPDALPFIGGVVLAVPCRVPQNIYVYKVSIVGPILLAYEKQIEVGDMFKVKLE